MTEEPVEVATSETAERRILSVMLVLLIVVLAGLTAFYLALTKPVQSVSAKKLKDITFLFQIFGPSTNDRFNRPTDVATDSRGNIYVTDTLNDRVAVFDNSGKYLNSFKTGVIRPLGIDVGPDGTVYVVSKRNDLVVGFDRRGKILRHYKAFIPLDVASDGKRVYISTIGPIVSYDAKTGKDRRLIGWQGRGKDEFAWPNGLAVRDGWLFVADTNNLRLKVLKPNGKVEWTLGQPPTKATFSAQQGRMFGVPSSVSLDEDGNIFVLDAFRDRIYLYGDNKKFVATWGGDQGDAEGQFDHPSGIAYGGDGVVYVVDKFNDRVQALRLAMPGEKPFLAFGPWCWLALLALLLLALLIYAIRKFFEKKRSENVSAGA